MSLAERGVKSAPKSKFEQWIDGLREDHRNIVIGWLQDPWYSNPRIADMIADDDPADGFTGYKAHRDTIAAWRKKHNVSR